MGVVERAREIKEGGLEERRGIGIKESAASRCSLQLFFRREKNL